MLLYHGSNVEVRRPRLLRSDRRLDFGPGFYTTSSLEQASKWAQLTARRRGVGVPLVSVYALDDAMLAALDVLKFDVPSREWLRYVGANRRGDVLDGKHDIVMGPVADDATMPVLRGYFAELYTEEEAIRRLLPQKLKDQYAFKTQEAIDVLVFSEVIVL